MFTTTTSRSNRMIFVPSDAGSPNNDLMKHISNLYSIARLDFERYSVAGEVIFVVEGDAMPTSQQDEEARIGTLAYALKKLKQPEICRDTKSSDPSPTGRTLSGVPRESRTYREYLKSLNEVERQLLNDAVNRKQGNQEVVSTNKDQDPLSTEETRTLLPIEEWTRIRQRARNIAWWQFAPEEAFTADPGKTALRLSDFIAHLQEEVQPRAVLSAQLLGQFITERTGFSYQGGQIPETVWKKLRHDDAQRLRELDDYATRIREEFYRGFESMDVLRVNLNAGESGITLSVPNTEALEKRKLMPEESRDRNPTEDAAEFIRCLNIICDESDARGRQTIASYYYNEIAKRSVSEVLKEMGLLAMQLASLNTVVEVTETEEANVMCSQSDSSTLFDPDHTSDSEDAQSLFEQEVAAIAHLISGRRKATWGEETDDTFKQENVLDQYDECGVIITMSDHERTIACGRVDPEFTTEDLPECARHLAVQLRRDYANGVRISQIWADIDIELESIFPISIENDDGPIFISHANAELQRFIREVLDAILNECQQDFHLSTLHSNPVYRCFHKAIRKTVDTRAIGKLMKQAYEVRQSGILPVKQFIALRTAAILQRERLSSARLSKTAFSLIKEIRSASSARLRYMSWAFYGDNQPSHPIHSLSGQEIVRVWAELKSRQEAIAAPNKPHDHEFKLSATKKSCGE